MSDQKPTIDWQSLSDEEALDIVGAGLAHLVGRAKADAEIDEDARRMVHTCITLAQDYHLLALKYWFVDYLEDSLGEAQAEGEEEAR